MTLPLITMKRIKMYLFHFRRWQTKLAAGTWFLTGLNTSRGISVRCYLTLRDSRAFLDFKDMYEQHTRCHFQHCEHISVNSNAEKFLSVQYLPLNEIYRGGGGIPAEIGFRTFGVSSLPSWHHLCCTNNF